MLKIQGNAHFVTRAAFGAMGLALLVAASVAPAQAKVLAKVNGVEITGNTPSRVVTPDVPQSGRAVDHAH